MGTKTVGQKERRVRNGKERERKDRWIDRWREREREWGKGKGKRRVKNEDRERERECVERAEGRGKMNDRKTREY